MAVTLTHGNSTQLDKRSDNHILRAKRGPPLFVPSSRMPDQVILIDGSRETGSPNDNVKEISPPEASIDVLFACSDSGRAQTKRGRCARGYGAPGVAIPSRSEVLVTRIG
jgi:hypothetical protein